MNEFELKIMRLAYNKGFRDAGGEAEDSEPLENWERLLFAEIFEKARSEDAPAEPSGDGPPTDAATATGMYDHD